MKKHFLFLASLVLGFGQLFADQVTFSLADLRATLPSGNTNVEVPYTWKVSPYHVSVTIAKKDGTTGTLAIANTTTLTNYTLTVNIAGEGSLDGATITTNPATQAANVSASNGSYENGTWAPAEGGIKSVTFTPTSTFRMTQIVVDYTPDSGYTPDVPVGGFTEPFEATPVDNLASYTGNDPYIYDKASMKYYALNSNGEYEEYGIVTEVNTLKVAGNAVTEIEYIKSPSNAYINLNYIPKASSKAVCTLVAEEGGAWKAAYGCGYYQNGWKDRFCFFTTNATINLGGETGNSEAMRYGEKIVTVLDAVAGKMDIFEADGTTLIGTITDSPKTADCKTPLYVFAQNKDVPGGGTQTDCYNPYMTLYGLQLYEGEIMVMDLVPAINGEGKGGLKDKLTGTFYGSANSAEFELSADGQAMAGQAGITAYEGKIVIYNNHEYEYFNGSWVDRGEMAYQAVPEIGTDYKNLSNWSYPGSAYDATFGVNVFDGTTNTLNPYEGNGGWEPLSFKLTGLTKGESYRASFVYSGTAWHSWSSYTVLPFFVLDNENMPDNAFNNPSASNTLGYIALPNTAVSDQSYSTVFTANHNYALLCIQFGVCDDGSHDPAFAFSFGNINVEKRVLPQAYNKIDWADPVKYTALEYIEATSQARENTFTLPYVPVTATQIDAKFQVYDTSTGWCGIFSARNVYAGSGISLYMNGNDRAHFGYFTGGTTGAGDNFAPFSLNTDYEVQADVTKLVVNGETYETGNTVTNATTRQLSLFANPEWDNPMRGRFYYCNISEAGEAVYNFKPVMRHDGKFGFYDKASRIFVMPAQGKLDGYGFATLEEESYIYFTTEPRSVFIGFTEKFEPTVQNVEGAAFTWTSSNTDVATVAADGTVTGVAKGTVTITATDTNSDWVASYTLDVEPATVAADKVEVWDGQSDAIVGSIRWSGDSYKPAYTITFDSGMGYNGDYFNHVFGVPAADENQKAWYEADFTMTNTPEAVWSYNSDVLPSGWPGNMGDVYVRRYFKAQGELPAQLYMPAAHDDAPCEYYINGTLVWSRTGEEPGVNGWYEDEVVKLSAEQRALIKTDGTVNVFAYHVHQNWGGRYADGGIYGNSLADGSPSKRFEDNDDLKRLPIAVAQAEGVPGFPADVLEYCQNATVCMQDANRAINLIRWELRKALSPRHDYDFASAEPADGLECWLYNVGSGQFLCGSNDWGTHASVEYNISAWPLILRANTSGENRYAIQTNLPNGLRGANDGLGHNGYVDCGYGDDFTTNEGWAWTFEAAGNGNYRIIQSGREAEEGKYLGMTEDARYQVDTDKAGADNLYNQWKVITRAQLEELAAAATPENPADVSFFIHQNTFSQNDFDGNDKGAANADLNDSKWERNAGSVFNWKGNDVGGDYMFEMWNTKDVGKVWLVQEIEDLPAGQYYVECTGFYRDGNWDEALAGSTRQLAFLYAGAEDNCTPLPSIMDGANMGAGYGRIGDVFIPDGCEQAQRFFKFGAYVVQTPIVNVTSNGKLTIGVYREGGDDVKAGDWITVDNFRLYRVGESTIESVTVGDALYATYVAPVDVDFTGAEVEAFAAQTNAEKGYVHLEPVTTVPAGAAVVVKADAAGTYNVNRTSDAVLGTTNDLVAATADVTADGSQYILAKKDDEVGFHKASTGSTIAAGKGYLRIIGAGVKAFYPFGDDDATGIEGVEIAGDNAPIYNVAGQRLNKMQKGINIVGSKKILK